MVVPQSGEHPEGWLTRVMRILFGWKAASTRADLELVLTAEQPQSGFSPEEAAMLKNILGLRETRIERVMVPRADIVAVQQDIALGELVKVFEVAGHSRLVVYNDTLDDPAGMVHIRDLIAFMAARAAARSGREPAQARNRKPADLNFANIDLSMPLSAAKIVREMLYAPPSMPALDLLAKMQATRIHLALVIDEYGGTDGLVSMEDLVELIVGDIADEHDEKEGPAVTRQDDGSFLANGPRQSRRRARRDRRTVRRRRSGAGSRHARRLSRHQSRPCPGARRTRARTGAVRGRSARRRSAPGQTRARFICRKDRRPAAARELPALARDATRPAGAATRRANRPNPNTPRAP